MNLLLLPYIFIGVVISTLIALTAITSTRERKFRATAICAGGLIMLGAAWFGPLIWITPSDWTLAIPMIIAGLISALWFLPLGTTEGLVISGDGERVDEREIMFAREEYRSGTSKYDWYYAAHPEHKEIDDKLRRLPPLLEPGGKYYDPRRSEHIKSMFSAIRPLTTQVDGEVSSSRAEVEPIQITQEIKKLAVRFGADETGIARLNRRHVYSHVGRGPEAWGQPIVNNHPFAIVFTLEMAYEQVEEAPALPITEETSLQYLRAALISVSLARYIRTLGYSARAHISESNYQIILPAVAHDAGLGEIGRLGYLISPKFGARIRLGGVTTNLPLIPDKPITFGVQDFCRKCLKCATNCPSNAIPSGSETEVRGVEKWPLNIEQCLYYWRLAGTDCGLCMKVCPFSHPPTLMHNLVRTGIRNSAVARTLAVWGDDLLYGRKPGQYRL